MKPRLGGVSGEAKPCSRVTLVSVGQCGWTGLVIGQLILLQMLVFTSEGCSKSQSYDASTSRAGPPHSTTTAALPHTSRPTSASHKLPCSTKQIGLAGCLNGGSCFMIELHNSSSTAAHCSCTSDWSGDRCEYKYVDPTEWPSYEDKKRLQQIFIAIGIATVVLVAAILIFVALYKRKQCRRATSSTVSGNSTTATNHDQTTPDDEITREEQKQSLNPKCTV